jgi:predicted AlkP superfamily phosphohydrolase/phosphomutase
VPAPRLTVIGLDAATFDVIDPLIASGDLPNLRQVFDRGSRGVLRSTTHPLTPHAWTTMVTGVNAARHGIWDFAERTAGGYELRLVNGSHRKAPAFWDYLGLSGRRVGLLNVPFTWPAPELDGFAVAGFDAATRDTGMTHPPELFAELNSRFGRLDLDHRFPLGSRGQVELDIVRRAAEQKVNVARTLVERFEPDILFVVLMSADHIHHLCWPEWVSGGRESAVADVYRALDVAVGGLLEIADGGDVMVVSDHGGGSLEGVINLNAWLESQGFLSYVDARALRRAQLRQRALLLRRTLIPPSIRRQIKRSAPGLGQRASRLSASAIIDWSGTRVFAYGTFGNLVVNLRGREEHGVVEPGDEYEQVREEVASRLLELRAPDGTPIVAAVYRREDLFSGDYLEKVPDLLVEFRDYAWLGRGNLRSRTASLWDRIEIERSARSYVGSHRHEGIIALAGPSIASGVEIAGAIEDVTPTILYLLGETIPDDLDGRVLEESIAPSLLEQRPPSFGRDRAVAPTTVSTYSADEAEEVESRLRGLGYLE